MAAGVTEGRPGMGRRRAGGGLIPWGAGGNHGAGAARPTDPRAAAPQVAASRASPGAQ
jgi:hypothetical protein